MVPVKVEKMARLTVMESEKLELLVLEKVVCL